MRLKGLEFEKTEGETEEKKGERELMRILKEGTNEESRIRKRERSNEERRVRYREGKKEGRRERMHGIGKKKKKQELRRWKEEKNVRIQCLCKAHSCKAASQLITYLVMLSKQHRKNTLKLIVVLERCVIRRTTSRAKSQKVILRCNILLTRRR